MTTKQEHLEKLIKESPIGWPLPFDNPGDFLVWLKEKMLLASLVYEGEKVQRKIYEENR